MAHAAGSSLHATSSHRLVAEAALSRFNRAEVANKALERLRADMAQASERHSVSSHDVHAAAAAAVQDQECVHVRIFFGSSDPEGQYSRLRGAGHISGNMLRIGGGAAWSTSSKLSAEEASSAAGIVVRPEEFMRKRGTAVVVSGYFPNEAPVCLLQNSRNVRECMPCTKDFSQTLARVVLAGCSANSKCFMSLPRAALQPLFSALSERFAQDGSQSEQPEKKKKKRNSGEGCHASCEQASDAWSLGDGRRSITLQDLLQEGLEGFILPLNDFHMGRECISYFLRDEVIHSIHVDGGCRQQMHPGMRGKGTCKAAARKTAPTFQNMCGSVMVYGYFPQPALLPYLTDAGAALDCRDVEVFGVPGNFHFTRHASGTIVKFKVGSNREKTLFLMLVHVCCTVFLEAQCHLGC